MQHLDEGTLQTWLDRERAGLDPSELAAIESHLATCDECTARLDELEGLDGRANALLAVDRDLELAGAPFEQIVERAEGTRGRRRALTRLRSLAWAASIVLAVGIGWMTNDLYRGDVAPRAPRAEELEAPEAPSADADRAARSRESSELPQAEASGPSEVGAPPPPAPTRPSVVADAAPASDDAVADRAERLSRAVEPVAPPTDALAEPRSDAADRQASGGGAQDAQATVAEPRAAVAGAQPSAAARMPASAFADATNAGRVMVSGRIVDDQSGEPIAAVQVYVEDLNVGALTQEDGTYNLLLPPADDSDSSYEVTAQRIGYRTQTQDVVARLGDAPRADFTMAEEAVQLQEVVVTGTVGRTQRRALGNTVSRLSASLFDWQPDEREAVEDAVGRGLVTVPGLPVLSVEAADGDAGRVARIRQELGEDGSFLTLVQGVSAEGDLDWPIEPEGALASVRVGGLLITGTAPVSADSLDVLLRALR